MTLHAQLLALHAAAAAAIKPGMSLDAWHDQHFTPLVAARVDAWLAVARTASPDVECMHLRLRDFFYPREDALLTRAEAAAKQPKPRRTNAPRRGQHISSVPPTLSMDAI